MNHPPIGSLVLVAFPKLGMEVVAELERVNGDWAVVRVGEETFVVTLADLREVTE